MQNYMIEEPLTEQYVDQTPIAQNNTIQNSPSLQEPTVPHIAIQNSSTLLSDQDVLPVIAALQIQLDRDWQPAWNSTAKLVFYSKNQTVPATSWRISILDNSDVAGALGYHDESSLSVPYGKIFVQDAIMHGFNWSVTLSHELLEMMSNPWINLTVFRQMTNLGGTLYAYESCDAVENDKYGYLINQVLVSDFQYPAWFDVTPNASAKFDHMGHCKTSFEILDGGYMPVFDVITGSGWKSLNHQQQTQDPQPHHVRNRYYAKCKIKKAMLAQMTPQGNC